MTMFRIEELEAGPLLDQAVLLAMGAKRMVDPPDGVPNNVRERWPDGGCLVLTDGPNMAFYGAAPPFSTDWGIGGPIIDRERISVVVAVDDPVLVPGWWRATTKFWFQGGIDGPEGSGPTALVAAMRCYVASKVGPTIELRQPAWNVGTPTVTQGPPPGGEG